MFGVARLFFQVRIEMPFATGPASGIVGPIAGSRPKYDRQDFGERVDALHWIGPNGCWKDAAIHDIQIPCPPNTEIPRNDAVLRA